MSWQDVINTLIGAAAGALVSALAGWLRAREETRRYERHLLAMEKFRADLASAPEDARDELEKGRPSNPPPVEKIANILLVSLGSGVLGAMVAPYFHAVTEIADRKPTEAPLIAPAADESATSGECSKDDDCGKGCSCKQRQCRCATIESKPPPKKQDPRRSALQLSTAQASVVYAGDPHWRP